MRHISGEHKEQVRAVVGHCYALFQHRTAKMTERPSAEWQFSSQASSLENPLLTPSGSLGSHDSIDQEDMTTYREELLLSEYQP